jgi:hypothetical protein
MESALPVTRALRRPFLCLSLVAITAGGPAYAEVGSLSLYGGFARLLEDGAPDGSFGARVNLFAQLGHGFSIGPELGYFGLGSGDHVWFATAAIRLADSTGKVRPYGIFAPGGYFFGGGIEASLVGFGLGAGVQVTEGTSGLFWGLEGRWHSNIQDIGASRNFATVLAEIGTEW